MRVLRVFFLGVIYGWFMRWIIDEIYARDHLRMITDENMLLRERVRELEAPKALAVLPEQRTELAPVPDQPTGIVPRNEALTPAPPPTPAPARQANRNNQRDDLKLIKGIGPQLEKKLHSAGVTSFDQMSRLTADELQAILGISKRAAQNADNLLSQAKKFAQQNANR